MNTSLGGLIRSCVVVKVRGTVDGEAGYVSAVMIEEIVDGEACIVCQCRLWKVKN